MEPLECDVLELFDARGVSGPTRQAVALADALKPLGWRTTFVAVENGPINPFLSSARAAGVAVHPLRADRSRPLLAELRSLISRYPDAVVCSHSYRFDILLAVLRLTGRMRNPWICMHHGVTTETKLVRLYHWLDRQAARCADGVVVVSRSQLDRFRGINGRISFVPNAILPSAASRYGERSLAGPKVPLHLLFVGRLSSEKAPDRALEILHRVRRAGRDARLTLAGDGPERAALMRRADSLGIEACVEFVGHVTDPWPLYQDSDVLIIPSRSEGMPNALLEALDAGVPVVAADVGEIRAVLGDYGALGAVVGSGTVVADTVSCVLNEPWRAYSTFDRSDQRRHVLQAYSLSSRARLVSAAYRSACPAVRGSVGATTGMES